jgi:hypothetical protein
LLLPLFVLGNVITCVNISEKNLGLGFWCLTPLSTIFQLYPGGQLYWFRVVEFNVTLTQDNNIDNDFYVKIKCMVPVNQQNK